MRFVHEDPEFDALLRIVAEQRGLALALVEKDYWVTHVLWALHQQSFDVWFKGGTSLSKGFDLIERFSEDLDLMIEPGRREDMPRVRSWKSEGTGATRVRRAYVEWLATHLRVGGAAVRLDAEKSEEAVWRAADLQVHYPGLHAATLPPGMKPYVLIEVGGARVIPFIGRNLTSFVHEPLEASGMAPGFADNRPRAVRCVHPLVTLLEKLDALGRRASREDVEPAAYVRHYEDAARIIMGVDGLPPLTDYPHVRALATEMCEERQLRGTPTANDPAFDLGLLAHAQRIRHAYGALDPMYWGPRLTIDEACETIRAWIGSRLA